MRTFLFKKIKLSLAILVVSFPAGIVSANELSSSPELIQLSNGHNIQLTVSPKHGGEIAGIRVKHKGQWHQLIYKANDFSNQSGWRGKAPLLWPATGGTQLKNETLADGEHGHYFVDNKKRAMPFHGFARNSEWHVVSQKAIDKVDSGKVNSGEVNGAKVNSGNKNYVVLQFDGQAKAHQFYPFNYHLSVSYRLDGDKIIARYNVIADKSNSAKMPFAIGNHITFNAPLIAGSRLNQTMFEISSRKLLLKDSFSFPTGEVINSPFTGKIALDAFPNRTPISLAQSDGISKLSMTDPSGLTLFMQHSAKTLPKNNYIDFNLWADFDAGYFSPEPWVGSQNALNNGIGLTHLAPGEAWWWEIVIRLSTTEA